MSPHGRPRLSVYAAATSSANSYTNTERRLKEFANPMPSGIVLTSVFATSADAGAERIRLGDRVLGVRVREELVARPRLVERAGQVFRCHCELPSPSA